MDKNVRKINDILVNLFNMVLKLEEESIRETAYSDLSITEIHTLVAIGTGRPKTMTHIANILGISVSTLTTAINKLVKKSYVERVRDEEDRRIVKIHLTEKGIDAVKAHEEFHETMIGEAIAHIPDDRMQEFISSIDNINQFLMMRSSMAQGRNEEFSMKSIKLGSHHLPVPIVQAGMSIGVAGCSLASAVAIEGGLGLIGTSELGFQEDDYETNRHQANLRAIEAHVSEAGKRVKEAKGEGLIGVSIMWNRPEAPEYVRTAIKAGAQVIVTSAGLPTDLPKYCVGKNVALLPTISSRRAASAIIKSWSQKYNRVPDGFIFQGPLAAGLLGFKESQLEKAEQQGNRLIADIKSALVNLENCPLIVGGDIFDRTDAEKAWRYGADGFLMGTRFVATEECDAPEEYKKLYLNCNANDVTIIKSPMKTSVRAMENSFTKRIAAENDADYDIVEAVRRGAEGAHEEGLIFCSVNVGRITGLESVRDVFKEFTDEE